MNAGGFATGCVSSCRITVVSHAGEVIAESGAAGLRPHPADRTKIRRTRLRTRDTASPPCNRITPLGLLDNSNEPLGRLKVLLKMISDVLIHDGDVFGIVSTGPSSLSEDMTDRREVLTRGIANAFGAGLPPFEIADPAAAVAAPGELQYRAKISLSTAYAMLKRLEEVRASRKAIIYISSGYNFDLPPSLNTLTGAINPFLKQGNTFSDDDLRDQMAELVRQATRAQVTIFAIDPRAMAGAAAIDPNVNSQLWQQYWRTTRATLQVISERTGGFPLPDEPELAEGLARIDRLMRK